MTDKEWEKKMKSIRDTNKVLLDVNRGKKIYDGLAVHKIIERSSRAKIENPDYDWSDEERDYYEQ